MATAAPDPASPGAPVHPALQAALAVCAAVPWLNPFAPSPTAYAVPWFVALGALSALLVLCAFGKARLHDLALACLAGWLAAGVLNALIALVQYFGWSQELSTRVGGWLNATPAGQAYGHLRQRNQFATHTCIALLAVFCLWHHTPQTASAARRGLLILATALLVCANAATTSRIGLVGLLLLTGAILVLAVRHKQRGWLGLGLAMGLTYLSAAWLLPRLLLLRLGAVAPPSPLEMGALTRMGTHAGCEDRRVLWHNILELIAQRPWGGWGWGELDFAHYSHLYQWGHPPVRFCDIVDHAHNLSLQLAVELGLPLTIAAHVIALWWMLRQQPWRETQPLRLVAWGILGILGLHSMVEYPLWYGSFFCVAALCAGFLEFSRTGDRSIHRTDKTLLAGTGTILAALVLWLGLDFHRVAQAYWPASQRSSLYADDPLGHALDSTFFRSHAEFARLGLTAAETGNAHDVLALAERGLHHSPEPAVIEKLLAAARLAGREDVFEHHRLRYERAFPDRHRQWLARQGDGATKSPD